MTVLRLAAHVGLVGLAACGPLSDGGEMRADRADGAPEYRVIETRFWGEDLLNIVVEMTGAEAQGDVALYARCAAAQFALIRGYSFARHVRTSTVEEAGVWRADAVYTISPALPAGAATLDAEVTVANCTEQGIPTV